MSHTYVSQPYVQILSLVKVCWAEFSEAQHTHLHISNTFGASLGNYRNLKEF
jgi:hypothetical protein